MLLLKGSVSFPSPKAPSLTVVLGEPGASSECTLSTLSGEPIAQGLPGSISSSTVVHWSGVSPVISTSSWMVMRPEG